MLVAYGDDSSDRKKDGVFAAAVIVGRESEWKVFESDGARNGERPFHATDCDSDGGEFRHSDHKENKALYRSNIELLVKSPFIGYAIAISIQDYRDLFSTEMRWPTMRFCGCGSWRSKRREKIYTARAGRGDLRPKL